MSVGDVPMSDEDLAALRRPVSIVPQTEPAVEGPALEPPGFIDQVNAQPLAAPVSGTNQDETAFPPPVPTEAPGMVPMPPPLPGAPPAPGAAAAPPAQPKDALAQADQDVRTAATGAAAAREKADQAQLTAAEGGAGEAHEAHNAAIDQLANKQDEIDKTEKLQAQYDAADKEAQQRVDDAAKARKNFSFRSYWADKSSATRIASALFQALGAFGAGLTRGPNYALQILDKQMDDDHRDQVERLQQLSDDEVKARTGVADAREARKQALLQIQTNAAQGDAMIAAQLRAASAKSTDDNFKKNVDSFAAKLQQDSAQKLLEARVAVRNGILKEQDDAAKRAEQAARTNLLNVQAAHGGFARVARGTGGGGGAGSSGDAVAQLKEAIQNGKNGQPLTAPEIQRVADGLGIPAFAKAGRPSVEAITKSVAFVQGQGAKEDKAANQEIDKRAAETKKELFGPKGPGTQYERLNGMTSVVQNAIAAGDKTAATAVLEEAGGMLSGGKSTKNTVELLHSLQSARDELSAKWGHLTGDPGATKAYTERLNSLLNRVKEEKRQEIDQIRARAVDAEMGEHGLAKAGKSKERALGHLSMFNGVTNADGSPRYGGGAGAQPQGGSPAAVDPRIELAQKAAKPGSGATPDQVKHAKAFLASVGR